jgi:hypothetical protein
MAIRHRITTLPDPGPTNKSRRASLFGEGSPYLPYHRALSGCYQAVQYVNINKFSIREWLVPPVLLPIVFVLLVAAAMLIQ